MNVAQVYSLKLIDKKLVHSKRNIINAVKLAKRAATDRPHGRKLFMHRISGNHHGISQCRLPCEFWVFVFRKGELEIVMPFNEYVYELVYVFMLHTNW